MRLTTGPCRRTPAGGSQEERWPCLHLNIDNRSDGYPMLAHAGEAYVHADVVSLPRLISISEEAAGRRAARGHMSDKPELEGIIWITEGEREMVRE